jgi:ferredoxin-NADP reductase/Na+-translocating ferredoxin:NAD+ oxidoreductase RnfD subunit
MINLFDTWLDNLSMYRLVQYYLIALLTVAAVLSLVKSLPFTAITLAICTLVLVVACMLINKAFSHIFSLPSSNTSAIITALILALIITPDVSKLGIVFLVAVSGLAMASKYLLVLRDQHVFNPAAIAVLLTALASHQTASWWVGSAVMAPYVIIGGLILARKVRRFTMIVVYLFAAAASSIILAQFGHQNILANVSHTLVGSATLFVGFVMLTEPFTSPGTHMKRLWYGALVGALLPPQVHILSYYASPEAALVAGNIFTRSITQTSRRCLRLREIVPVAANSLDIVFDVSRPLQYEPGQYMELTVPHAHPDSRGIRRYFTLASSPTELTIRFGVKFTDPGSSYKQALSTLRPGSVIFAAQLAGDFRLPRNRKQKLVFIAGGIGITPYRSMVQYMLDSGQPRDVIMLYAARTLADIAYSSVLEDARKTFGMKTIYALSSDHNIHASPYIYANTTIDAELIRTEIPDYLERVFYISGTHAMVSALSHELRGMDVSRSRIQIDFFPGYI